MAIAVWVRRWWKGLAVAMALGVIAVAAAPGSYGSNSSPTQMVAAWTQLGPKKVQVVRVVMASGGCPDLTLRSAKGNTSSAMTVRAQPSPPAFPDTVCETAIPAGTTEASLPGHSLPLRPKKIRRIALIGDTGCKIPAQACNQSAWPFAENAAAIAGEKPDLTVHLGDLLYRTKKYSSAAIQADFFTPATRLLAAAPLVMVRGNHEEQTRDCVAWYRYFAFSPPVATCGSAQRFTPPYRIKLTARRELVVIDSSAAPTSDGSPADIDEYKNELELANSLATQPAWLISHVPLWVVAGKSAEAGPGILQKALQKVGRLSPNFRMIISGHLHQFEYLSLMSQKPGEPPRQEPAQLILGDGGTLLSSARKVKPRDPVDESNHVFVDEGRAMSVFGYGVIQLKGRRMPNADPKSVTIKEVDGSVVKCTLHRYRLHCS